MKFTMLSFLIVSVFTKRYDCNIDVLQIPNDINEEIEGKNKIGKDGSLVGDHCHTKDQHGKWLKHSIS